MFHPANGPSFAPRARCSPSSGVRLSSMSSATPRCYAGGDVLAPGASANGGRLPLRMGDPYDVVVIGAGTGGYSAALRAAQLGKRVALVERDDRLGGTCLLRGCIPTKALLQSAAVMDTVERSSEWGIKAAGEPDWSAIQAFDDASIRQLVQGVTVLVATDTEATGTYDADGASQTVGADICLVAIGRGPVTEGLGVADAGVALDQKGYVQVDDHLRTTVPGIWAVGDVAATPLQLAHVAFTEGMAVAERIAGIDVPPIDYHGIPRVTYSSPELASVGLTEAEAREAGREIVVENLDFRAIGKAN